MPFWVKAVLALTLLVLSSGNSGFCLSGSEQRPVNKIHPDKQTSTPQTSNAVLTAEEKAWLRKHPIIRVVQDPGWPPIEFIDKQGIPIGMSADYLKIIEQRLGVTFERIRGLNWQESYTRLRRWDIDMTTSVAETDERRQFWTFTKPYMKIPIVIVTRIDVTYISHMKELAGKKVAIVEGYAVGDWIPHDFPDIELIKVKNAKEGLEFVQQEKVFALIENMLVVSYYMAKSKTANVKVAGETPYVNAQAMAVRKDWAPLAGILQKMLDSISETERNEIFRKWVPIRYEHGFDYTTLWYALTGFILILSGMAVWNRKLSREIESRKVAEAALRENENRLRDVQEMARLGFWRWNVKTGDVEWSEEVYKIFQLDTETFTPHIDSILALSPWPGDHERDRELIRRAMENHDKGFYEQRFLRPDGSVGYYYSTFQGIYNDGGDLVSILGTVQDITERKHAEEALQQSEEKFRTIANYTVDWESWFGPDGKYLWVNPAVERITGYTADEILAMPDSASALIAEEDREMFMQRFRTALSGTRGENFEVRYLHKNGAKLWLSASWQPVYDMKGNFLGFRSSSRDITAVKEAEAQRIKLEKQLFEAQKMEAIGTLAGGIAHDFNNILSGIIGYAELAFKQADLEIRRQHIRQILNAAERAKNLVKQILAFSRNVEQDKKPMDFNLVIKEAMKLLRATIPTTISMRQKLTANPIIIHADYTQMHQLIMNICTNAAHAIGEKGGVLDVTLSREEIQSGELAQVLNIAPNTYAKLSISDTGHGIDPAHMGRLFDPFFTTKKVGEGTGLGLAVVYGIVQNHGGKIRVASQPGQGSTFDIYLPLLDGKAAQITEDLHTDIIPRGKERILFVDDEEELADLGYMILTDLGYKVNKCIDSREALRLYRKAPGAFDVVITDMNMPWMSGSELAEEILKLRSDQAIILCTGYSDFMDSEKASQMGIKDFVLKPLTSKTLAERIRKVLRS